MNKVCSTRDLLWLALLGVVLGCWGWDRGRLAMRLEAFNQPAPQQAPGMTGTNVLSPLGGGGFRAVSGQ